MNKLSPLETLALKNLVTRIESDYDFLLGPSKKERNLIASAIKKLMAKSEKKLSWKRFLS